MEKIIALILCVLFLAGCSDAEPILSSLPADSGNLEGTTVATLPVTQPTPPTVAPTQPTLPAATTVPTQPTAPPDEAEILLASMTTEEKVGQLFLARCPATNAIEDIQSYHLGGYILFARDFENENVESIRKKLSQYQSASSIPLFIAVDEEGGTVTRVSRFAAFRDVKFKSPRVAFASGGMDAVLTEELEKAQLLTALGINVNMGPVCDITDDPFAFMYDRSLGQSPELTGDFVEAVVAIADQYHLGSVLKHFPGYGNNADTHVGIAVDDRTYTELLQCDLIPFISGIDAGCDAVLISHTIISDLDPNTPASLSARIHRILREDLGFQGVIVTDDLAMEAITDTYGATEAAILAVLAGNDLLCSTEYAAQYAAVLEAVQSGRIPEEILDQAVLRILRWKIELELI